MLDDLGRRFGRTDTCVTVPFVGENETKRHVAKSLCATTFGKRGKQVRDRRQGEMEKGEMGKGKSEGVVCLEYKPNLMVYKILHTMYF